MQPFHVHCHCFHWSLWWSATCTRVAPTKPGGIYPSFPLAKVITMDSMSPWMEVHDRHHFPWFPCSCLTILTESLANRCKRLWTVANGCKRLWAQKQRRANTSQSPDPQSKTRTIRYAFGKKVSERRDERGTLHTEARRHLSLGTAYVSRLRPFPEPAATTLSQPLH